MTAPGRGTALRGSLIVVIASAACAAVVACSGFSSSEGSTDDAGAPTTDSDVLSADSGADGSSDGGTAVGDASTLWCGEAGTCKRVFVTSQMFPAALSVHLDSGGILSGLAAGDEICRALALDAGLGGANWVAWLSTFANLAKDRVANSGQWTRADGTTVTLTLGESNTINLTNPIDVTEHGVSSTSLVWTGTGYIGGVNSPCGDWSTLVEDDGTVGQAGKTDEGWTNIKARQPCKTATAALYCFEK